MSLVYMNCTASERMVITSAGRPPRVVMAAWVPWWHKCIKVDMTAVDHNFTIHIISRDRLEVLAKISFNIAVGADETNIIKFATLVGSSQQRAVACIQDAVMGHMREVCAQLTMDEIFADRQALRAEIKTFVSDNLKQFGLEVKTANFVSLEDIKGKEIFSVQGQLRSSAIMKDSAVAQAENSATSKQRQLEVEAETKVKQVTMDAKAKQEQAVVEMATRNRQVEMEAKQQVFLQEQERIQADAVRAKAIAQASYDTEKITAETAVKIKAAQLQKQLNDEQAKTQDAKLRADKLIPAEVAVSIAQKEMETLATTRKTNATLDQYEQERRADAAAYQRQKAAEAELFARQREAEGDLYVRQKEAEAAQYALEKQAEGLSAIIQAFNGDTHLAFQWWSMFSGNTVKLAEQNAKALVDMKPNVNVTHWVKDGSESSGDGSDGAAMQIANIMQIPQMLPNSSAASRITNGDASGVPGVSGMMIIPQITTKQH